MSRVPAVCRRLCLGVFVFLLAPLHAAPWLKLQTEDVVIYSDARSRDVIEFATGYTAFRHVFREIFAPPQKTPPAVVLLFRDMSTLQAHVPTRVASQLQTVVFSADLDGVALLAAAVDGDRATVLQQTIQFDTIWSLSRVGYYVPLWMGQGAGEVLESLELHHGKCTIGDNESDYSKWRSTVLPWKRVFEVTTDSPEYDGPSAHGEFHAKAWALMHRVLLDGTKGPATFQALAADVRSVHGLTAALKAFGVSEAELESDIARHLRQHGRTRDFPFDSDSLRHQLKPEPAPEAEVYLQRANLLTAAGKPGLALQELARAQSLMPRMPSLFEARARIALLENEAGDAIGHYREAIALGSTNAFAYLRSAEERMNEASSGQTDTAGAGGATEALVEIRKALALSPGNADAYRLLGRALYLTPDLKPEDIEELSRGVTRGPAGESVRMFRALLYDRLGRKAEYIADLQQILDDPLSPSGVRRFVTEHLDKAKAESVAPEK